MAKHYMISYVVKGTDPFPMDMLRYDRSYPNGHKELPHTTHRSIEGTREVYEVGLNTIRSYKGDLPTVGRWNSFGWHVDLDSVRVQEVS